MPPCDGADQHIAKESSLCQRQSETLERTIKDTQYIDNTHPLTFDKVAHYHTWDPPGVASNCERETAIHKTLLIRPIIYGPLVAFRASRNRSGSGSRYQWLEAEDT